MQKIIEFNENNKDSVNFIEPNFSIKDLISPYYTCIEDRF